MQLKNLMLAVFGMILFCTVSNAQSKDPELLKEPAAWSFEKFTLPPVFAPSFPFHGFEELRFSPGMFTKGAPDYFTYAFAASIDRAAAFTKADITLYLEQYFKGLCFATARDRKLTVDTSQIKVSVQQKNKIYYAVLNIFGVFADGAAVTLNMEVTATADKLSSKQYLVFIASPQPKTADLWKQLYAVRESFTMPQAK